MNHLNHISQLKTALPLFYEATAEPLQKTEAYLELSLVSENEAITDAALYLLHSGGKRLRPGLLLLSAACGESAANEEKLISMAAALEMIHMASLVHDDIVDDTPLRRGKPTIARCKGRETALYTGNFILAKAIEITLSYGDKKVRDVAFETAAAMCRGEFSQMSAVGTADFNSDRYLERIKAKTANLIAAGCELGAYLGGASEETASALRSFGEHLGIAFQITDDILDYTANKAVFGKNTGSDIAEGLATMPLICAWESNKHQPLIKEFFSKQKKTKEDVEALISVVLADDGPKNAAKAAQRHIALAKEALGDVPSCRWKEGFSEIADYVLARNY